MSPFAITISGKEDAVREGIAKTLALLSPLALDQDAEGTVQLVLAEALNNVVEHAMAGDEAQGKIEIRGRHSGNAIELIIIDEGAPMPNGLLPVPSAPDVDVDRDDTPEGGFGWFMIQTLAQDVSYVRQDGQNRLTLRIAITE